MPSVSPPIVDMNHSTQLAKNGEVLIGSQTEHLQDVVEDLAQGQFGRRSTVSARETLI